MTRQLDRRTLLRGAAVALSLPYLDAMLPRARAASAAAQGARDELPTRLFYAYVPNGMPTAALQTGADFALERLLAPFASASAELLVLRGLTLDAARAYQDGPGDHARAAASFLTGVHPLKSDGQVLNGISADQIAAAVVGERTRLRSLQLGCEGSATSGQCDSGYACAYTSHMSWSGPRTPSGKESDPRAVFERLFLDEGEPAFAETREQRARRRKSVLDFVREDAQSLARTLGAEDRRKLDEYQSGVRELERRIDRLLAGTDADAAAGIPKEPADGPRDFAEHVRVLYELAAAAFITDSTRVGTFLVTNEGSGRSYPFAGVPEGHHEMSHHGSDPVKLAQWEKICLFHTEQFAAFVEKLRAAREGEGNVLQRTMAVFGSGISDGNRHNHDDLPIVLLGGSALGLKGSRALDFDKDTSLHRLHLALLAKMGAHETRLGDATTPLDLA
ncbi:MAG: DUF1552 domain-containing protein [Planctomycetes bacterium]|nr:DUF1552 domain-containing protein [Planctomycetota bacterium]